MYRVTNAVASLALAATVSIAGPAAAMPTGTPEDRPTATARKAPARPATPALGSKIKNVAMGQIGVPYSYGGMSPAGFDCSGFTSWVYSHIGVTLPHSSSAQYSLGGSDGFTTIADISKLEVGDLVFHGSGGIQHVGIYVGDSQFISATSSSGIQVRSLLDSYWGPLWVGGVRYSR